jgi:hypothetical protein
VGVSLSCRGVRRRGIPSAHQVCFDRGVEGLKSWGKQGQNRRVMEIGRGWSGVIGRSYIKKWEACSENLQ